MWHSTSSYGIRRWRCPMKTGTYWDMPRLSKDVEIRWWRHRQYQWEHLGHRGSDSRIRPFGRAAAHEHRLNLLGDDWKSVEALLQKLGPEPMDTQSLRVSHEQPLLAWCGRYGLPALLSLNATEVALPLEARQDDRGDPEDVRRVYVRQGGCWSESIRRWLEFEAVPESETHEVIKLSPSWTSPRGSVRLPRREEPLTELDRNLVGRNPEQMSCPLSPGFWPFYAENVIELHRELHEFWTAVTEFFEGDHGKIQRYTDAATLRPWPISKRSRRGGHPGWEVASLFSAFALQVVFGSAGERLVNCARKGCKRQFPTSHSRHKWCSAKCREAGRKANQRAAKKAAQRRRLAK